MRKFIILDTEYTAWQGSIERLWSKPGEHREIIQIGAVKAAESGNRLIEEDHLSILVKPLINPRLSTYIKKLTKISQPDLDLKGIYFKEAVIKFHEFCKNGSLPVFSWGEEIKIIYENAVINKIDIPLFNKGFYDIIKFFSKYNPETKKLTSGTIASNMGGHVQGSPHNAVHDARSIMAAINIILKQQKLKPSDFLSFFEKKNNKNSCSAFIS